MFQPYPTSNQTAPMKFGLIGNVSSPFYFGDDDFGFLVKMAGDLRARQYFVTFEDGSIYSSSYMGHMVAFFNSCLSEMATAAISANTTKWLRNDLPLIGNPAIEIGPDKILGCIQKTLDADPLGKLQTYRPRFDQLKTELGTGQFKGYFREAM